MCLCSCCGQVVDDGWTPPTDPAASAPCLFLCHSFLELGGQLWGEGIAMGGVAMAGPSCFFELQCEENYSSFTLLSTEKTF